MTDIKLGNYDLEPLDLKDAKVTFKKPKRKRNKMKKLLGALKRTITGENKTGEVIHGVLDILPIPNQPIAKAVRAIFDGDKAEAKVQLGKLLTLRNGVAVVAAILVLSGVVDVEDVKRLLDILGELGVNL